MRSFLFLVSLLALAALPVQAGVSVSVHIGGSGGYHGYSAGCYNGGYHGYYGGYHGGYGYSYGYGYPSYGIVSYGSYGYAPSYASYGEPVDYGYSAGSYPTAYAPDAAVLSEPAPTPVPTPAAPAAVSSAPSSLPLGKVDEFGYVHSPFTTSTFKVDTYANGQTFYDPLTGQPFTVQKAGATPKAPVAPTTSIPAGKIDEFGYIHSPYSTFTVKARSDTTAQLYQDPNTGQFFTAVPKIASKSVVTTQVVD